MPGTATRIDLALTAVASLLVLAAVSCSSPGLDLSSDISTVEARVQDTTCPTADVAWEVWTVTWEDRHRGVETLPWSMTRDLWKGEVDVSVSRECDDNGLLSIEIWIDGRLDVRRQALGPFATLHAGCDID